MLEATRARVEQLVQDRQWHRATCELERIADVTLQSGHSSESIELLGNAVELSRRELQPDVTERLLFKRALLAAATLSSVDAARHWDEHHAHCQTEGDAAGCTRSLLFRFDTADNASELVDAACAIAPVGSGWEFAARALRDSLDGAYAESTARARQAIDVARDSDDHLLESRALATLAFSLVASGAGDGARTMQLWREALAVARLAGDHVRIVGHAHNLVVDLVESLQLVEARAVADQCASHIDTYSLERMRGRTRLLFAMVHVRSGQPRAALESARTSVLGEQGATSFDRALGLVILTEAMIECGRPQGDIDAMLDELDRTLASSPFESVAAELSLHRAMVHTQYARGRFAGSIDYAGEPRPAARGAHWFARAALWTNDAGLRTVADEALRQAERAGDTRLPPLVQLEIRESRIMSQLWNTAMVAAAEAEMGVIAATWASSGHALNAARCQATVIIARFNRASSLDIEDIDELVGLFDSLIDIGALADARRISAVLSELADPGHSARISGSGDAQDDLLAGLSDHQRSEIDRHAVRIPFTRGKVLSEAGVASGMVAILVRGRASRVHETSDGRRLRYDLVDPGGICNEEALFGTTPDNDVIALEDGEVAMLRAGQLQALARQIPRLGINLATVLWRRGQADAALARSIAYDPLETRLASRVLDLARRYGHPTLEGHILINVRLTQGEIAELVGASRPAAAAVIGAWRRLGLIDVRSKRIVVIQPEALANVSQRAAA